MSSVFEGVNDVKDQVLLADTIVTSVFMGLTRERLVGGYQYFIGYGGGFDAYEGSQVQGGDKKISDEDDSTHQLLEALLKDIFPAYAGQLVIGPSNKWIDNSKGKRQIVPTSAYVITGAPSAKQIHREMSVAARRLALDLLNSNRYQAKKGDDLSVQVSKERGAYYGVADLDNGEVYGPVATTRHVWYEQSGRWMRDEHGWIGGNKPAPGSNAKMDDTDDERLFKKGIDKDTKYVVGYCHGMIFAQHICKVAGGGCAYEVSMNEQTCKNASCFGCSTFMFANGMPPSWMHLGSAESWAPLPEKAGNYGYKAHFNHHRIESVARLMNQQWANCCAQWMKEGVRYTNKSPRAAYLKQKMTGKTNREIALWFLDALTIHGRGDLERILSILTHH